MASYKRLWAPWRSGYLSKKQPKGCFLCRAAKTRKDSAHQVVHRGEHVFALLNRYPYNNGHMLIAPYRHIGRMSKLTDVEWNEIMPVCRTIMDRLRKLIKPQGFNIGANIGRSAGAGVPGHFHLHLVPRWRADTNFMPVINSTKVIAQSLEALYQALQKGK